MFNFWTITRGKYRDMSGIIYFFILYIRMCQTTFSALSSVIMKISMKYYTCTNK